MPAIPTLSVSCRFHRKVASTRLYQPQPTTGRTKQKVSNGCASPHFLPPWKDQLGQSCSHLALLFAPLPGQPFVSKGFVRAKAFVLSPLRPAPISGIKSSSRIALLYDVGGAFCNSESFDPTISARNIEQYSSDSFALLIRACLSLDQ